ncbi:hypothetical protein [Sporosarcina sp. FSL K6-3457]|uniref:hypothetical protein n=1 Tax=Sporosarcina sp. FSL K6-3457 TaxID=2978204 RepID=UPI0030F78582
MKKMINNFNEKCVKMYVLAKDRTFNEKGSTTVEWVGLAVVALALMIAISAFLKEDTDVGGAIAKKVSELIGNVGGGN